MHGINVPNAIVSPFLITVVCIFLNTMQVQKKEIHLHLFHMKAGYKKSLMNSSMPFNGIDLQQCYKMSSPTFKLVNWVSH